MSGADKCWFCGEYVPEGRQVCELCERMDPGERTALFTQTHGDNCPLCKRPIIKIVSKKRRQRNEHK